MESQFQQCKYCYWQAPKISFDEAKKAAYAAFDACSTDVICHFMNHSWWFMSVYCIGHIGKATIWAIHKQKGHHCSISQSAMMHLDAIVS
jgi:hypothetical protein